jgi:hypothetical protein
MLQLLTIKSNKLNSLATMISKIENLKCLNIRRPKPIIVETSLLLLSSFLFNLSLPFTLGGQEFGNYAIGLTSVAISSIGSLGIPAIIPTIVLNDLKPERQILTSLIYQYLVSIFVFAVYFLIFKLLIAKYISTSVFTTRVFAASSLYFLGQTTDETIHGYLRNTGRQSASMKTNAVSKIVIVGYVLIAPIWIRNGTILFETVAYLIAVISFVKAIIFILAPHPWAIKSRLILPRILIKSIFSMWIGNTSNAIYSGIMRILLSSALGITSLGIIALSSQIATSFAMIASSLSFNAVFNPFADDDKTRKQALINSDNKSMLLAAASIAATLVAVGYIYFIRDRNIITVNELFIVLVPVSIGFSATVASVTCYQICQVSGAFRKINYINLIMSLIGLAASYLMVHVLGVSHMLYFVYMVTGCLNLILIKKLSVINRLTC